MLTVFFDVAYQSYLPHLVGRDNLVEGNAKLEGSERRSDRRADRGGFLIQALTAPVAIARGCAELPGFGDLRRAYPQARAAARARSRRSLGREMMEGLRFVLGNRLLRGSR